MASALRLVDGRSQPITVSRALLHQVGEDGVAAIDMATAAVERVRHNLFAPGASRARLIDDLHRALFEMQEIRPQLLLLANLDTDAPTTT